MSNRLLIRGFVEPAGGYGQVLLMVARELISRGVDVRIDPLGEYDEHGLGISPEIRARYARHAHAPAQLLFWLPDREFNHRARRTVHFTMWETCRAPARAMATLSRAEAVVVPSMWQASCFAAQGLDTPVYTVPLPVDPAMFWPEPMAQRHPFVFGTSGRNMLGVYRKRMDYVMDAFVKAFPDNDDVRLLIKCWPKCEVPEPDDPRIEVTRACLPAEELAAWYNSLHVYVTACAGGGWELMPHQAMACGRPVMAARFGGISEFFDDRSGWELDYRFGKPTDHYKGGGRWADVDRDSLIRTMQRAAAMSRYELVQIGTRAHQRAIQFDSRRTVDRLLPVLEKHRILY